MHLPYPSVQRQSPRGVPRRSGRFSAFRAVCIGDGTRETRCPGPADRRADQRVRWREHHLHFRAALRRPRRAWQTPPHSPGFTQVAAPPAGRWFTWPAPPRSPTRAAGTRSIRTPGRPRRRSSRATPIWSSTTSTRHPSRGTRPCRTGPDSAQTTIATRATAMYQVLASARGLAFRNGRGSCVIDRYRTPRTSYEEIACLVRVARRECRRRRRPCGALAPGGAPARARRVVLRRLTRASGLGARAVDAVCRPRLVASRAP